MCFDIQLRLRTVVFVILCTGIKEKQKDLYLRIGLQVVVEDVDRNGEVAGVKRVRSIPALRTKLPPLCHHSMEVAQGKQNALKLILPCTHF